MYYVFIGILFYNKLKLFKLRYLNILHGKDTYIYIYIYIFMGVWLSVVLESLLYSYLLLF